MSEKEELEKKLRELKQRRQARTHRSNIEETVENLVRQKEAKSIIPEEEQKTEIKNTSPIKQQQQNQQKQCEQQQANIQPQKIRNMEFVQFVGEINIVSKEKQTYEVKIQCNLDQEKQFHNQPDYVEEKEKTQSMKVQTSNTQKQEQQEIIKSPTQIIGNKQQIFTQPEKVTLSQEDISHITKSKNFLDFFHRSSKLVEKVLEKDQIDICALEDIIGQQVHNEQNVTKSYLTHYLKLKDTQYSQNRVITSLEWSPNRNDLLLASYSQNEQGNINDPVGLVALWSLGLKSRPEFYCFCQSQVTVAKFYPYQENLILGGLYNGQIVLWDLRAKTLPVSRTSFTVGHSYPIYSLDVVGSLNAHNIVSVSNDGKLCTWNLSMGTMLQKTVDQQLQNAQNSTKQKQDINVTCMQFPQGDTNNFYIGAEDGQIYRSQLHQKQNNSSQNIVSQCQAHDAMISSLSISNDPNGVHQLSGLVLTSSFDWTVKLWNPKQGGEFKHIQTFDYSEDYVFDVQWNTVNPTIFASVDGEGYLDIFDLSEDIENPQYHEQEGILFIQIQQKYIYLKDKYALNKCKWSNDGLKIATGDSRGTINIYNLDKKKNETKK
ncbi:hypothetical protein IMG5_196130 [Ichthyophthirius multifiliis]|uniref:Uncharacterized protein n=1 Tax=Ichthyophthirius multifiliis TaxID=5932 RepID=G0R529_ICHMU|nr:hypothetical protein IMG5_196130 [Ichthyophthirius multifiliis]EGR27431.1 hypothetical protein IMG5_196130 [Ichthyophthirius multifiliis]|eukprot:XP_004024341.1 hypothetical protein IMG5_196130 [Ichthyophthirius multifiliis]